MKKDSFFQKIFDFFDNNIIFTCIRNGLIALMPFIFIGSLSLIIYNFPLTGYQDFIQSFANGFLYKFFHAIYYGTFGYFSIFLTISISYHYIKKYTNKFAYIIGVILTSLVSFFII